MWLNICQHDKQINYVRTKHLIAFQKEIVDSQILNIFCSFAFLN